MLTAVFCIGDRAQITRVHRIPPSGEPGYSDYRPAVCGVVAGSHGWSPEPVPPPEACYPAEHRCPACFEEPS